MILVEIRNIEKLNNFCEIFKDESVVKSGLEEFKQVIRSIVFNGEDIQREDVFFNQSTKREKIPFKDFLKMPEVISLMKNVNRTDIKLKDIANQFSNSIDEILLDGVSMGKISRENHGRNLKEKMVAKTIDIKELESSHSYLASRLTDEMKNKLIENNSEFYKNIKTLVGELSSILS
ncbi:MAG: hypothetical protein PF481_02720 [Bacteroidales bacterium]|jgi:hypothetical protein|nr:hypothetical protein [Bacteroidales bacterium]